MTAKRSVGQPTDVMVGRLNRLTTGWANYFCLGQVTPAYAAVNQHADRRLRRWLCSKYKVNSGKHVRFSEQRVHDEFGLLYLSCKNMGLPWAKA